MRKLCAFLISLVILLAAAGALGETAPDLYDLYDNTQDGNVWIGTAIPILENVQIMSPAEIPEGEITDLQIWDGARLRTVVMALYTGNDKVLVLIDEEGEKTGIPEYECVDVNRILWADGLLVRSGDWMGSRINRAVYDVSSLTWQGMDAMLLTLSGDTTVGSAVLTKEGELAGMIVAEYAEGKNRYIALTVSEISKCLIEASELLNEEDLRPEGYEVILEENIVTFDWSKVRLPEVPEGKTLFHIVADLDSSYLTFLQLDPGDESFTMLLTPGRTYISGFVLCEKGTVPNDMPEQYARTTLPEAEPLTDYSFHTEILAIGDIPEDAADDVMPAEPAEITEEFLRSNRACIWSVTTYDVDKTSDGLSLLVTLTSPDGSNYRWESSWVYGPEYETRDEWYVRLPETGLLEMLNADGYPEGTYRLDMYIGGKLAGSSTFELKK